MSIENQGDNPVDNLSSRVRANSEAAPWVIEEIKRLEARVQGAEHARREVEASTYTRSEMAEVLSALWDMQQSPDCWCDSGEGAPVHSPACAFARDVTRKHKALAHQEQGTQPPSAAEQRLGAVEAALRESVKFGYLFNRHDEPLDDYGKRLVRCIISELGEAALPPQEPTE